MHVGHTGHTSPLIYAAELEKGKCGLLEIRLSGGGGCNKKWTDDNAAVEADVRGVADDVEMGEELVYVGEYLGKGKRVNEPDGAEDGELAGIDGCGHEVGSGRPPLSSHDPHEQRSPDRRCPPPRPPQPPRLLSVSSVPAAPSLLTLPQRCLAVGGPRRILVHPHPGLPPQATLLPPASHRRAF